MNILSGYPPSVDIHLCIFGNGYVSSAKLQLLHKKARPPPVPQTTWGLQPPEAIRSNSEIPGIRQCDINIRQTAIYDPACGTGGFLLAAQDYIEKNFSLDKDQKRFLKFKTFWGEDIVDGVVRLCAMNLYLHGIGGEETLIKSGDSLISDPGDRYDLVITNPPNGQEEQPHIQWT